MNQTLVKNFRLPSLLLAATLQLLPVVRAALPLTQNAANVMVVLFRWTIGGAAVLGGVHAVSGASTVVSNARNVKGTNGLPFSLRLTTAPHSSGYWTAGGLPAGLTLIGTPGKGSWKIEGTPVVEGTFIVRVTAKETPNSPPSRTVSATLVLNIVSPTSAPPVVVLPPAGTYNGLFYDSNHLEHASSGFFTVAVRSAGDFKAQLQNGTSKFTYTGRFDAQGRTTNQVSRVGKSTLNVELKIGLHGSNRITGRVTDGLWSSTLLAHRAFFHAVTNPATALAGKYTLVIPGGTDGATAPLGDGLGSLNVDPSGVALLTGTMADGSRMMQRVGLSGAGDWPFYASLYAGQGAVFGWLRVRPPSALDVEGAAYWIRPPGRLPKFYTNGFALASPVAGSFYTPPVGGIFETNAARVILTGGNLAQASTNAVTLAAGGRVLNAGPNPLTFTLTPATGLFKGTVKPLGAARPIPFQGAVMRGAGWGGGYFLGPNEIGHVYFGP